MQPIGSCIGTLQELFRENCIKGKLQNCIECQYHKSIIRWNITNCIYSKQHIINVLIEILWNTPMKNHFIYTYHPPFFRFTKLLIHAKFWFMLRSTHDEMSIIYIYYLHFFLCLQKTNLSSQDINFVILQTCYAHIVQLCKISDALHWFII